MHMYDSLDSVQNSVFVYLQKANTHLMGGITCSIHWVNYKFWFGHASMISMHVTDNLLLHEVNLI